jgi:murein DD-endopeptidase MepM/ murein hydrolase activator NlpD
VGRLKLLFAVLALGLLGAAPSPAPVPPQLTAPKILTVYQWIQVLPAPSTPAGWRPDFQFPLASYVETQPFGCTNLSIEEATPSCPGGFHTGIDLANRQGTPIMAAAAGLAYPFQDRLRYGNHVIVVHPGGYETVYGHMVRTGVTWGEPVQAGQVIGFVGSTGNSTGPHVHFEVRFAGVPQDPMPYLTGSPPEPFALPTGWQGSRPDDAWGPA